MGITQSLFQRPKNVGFRIGFIAILLIVITAIMPAFILIGDYNPQLASFQTMFLTGLCGTVFFSVMLRQVSMRSREDMMLSARTISKQVIVLVVGLIAGLIMIISNSFLYSSLIQNPLLGSIWGNIDSQAFYLGMLAGVSEELFFRGFIGTFMRLVAPNLLLAIIPSAMIFALFHYFAYSELAAFIVLFVLGIILGLIHEFTNDIGAPMLAHVLNNTFAMMPAVIAVITQNTLIIVGIVAICTMVILFRVAGGRK